MKILDNSPFMLTDQAEKPATKVWIANVPLSCSNSEIEDFLRKTGCELRRTLRSKMEKNAVTTN